MHNPRRGNRPDGGTARGSITVGIVARPTIEREALVVALDTARGFRALDCGDGIAESVERVRDLGVPIVLMALDAGPSVSFAASLRCMDPAIRIVAILRTDAEAVLGRLAAAGVVGFVPPTAGLAACIRTLRSVRSRGFDCPPELAAAVLRAREPLAAYRTSGDGPGTGELRGRQLEVAACLAQGLTNKEICLQLRIAEGTVKSHVHSVLTALGVQRRWEVAGALRIRPAPVALVPRSPAERDE